jgi:uncharacterized protein
VTNREQLERLYEEYARGDMTRGDIFDPEIESMSFGMMLEPQGRPWRGIDQLRAGMRDWMSTWEKPATLHAERIEEEGDRFCVFVRWAGRGRESGTPFEAEGAHLWEFRDGKAVRFDVYRNRDEAMAAFRRE